MDYHKRIHELKDKYTQFFADDSPGQIMVNICPYTYSLDYSAFDPTLKARRLDEWDFDRELREYVAYTVQCHRIFMAHTHSLDNDYVPALNMHFGFGVHSAFLSGAEVIMGEETSWTRPWLTDWDKLETLRLNRENRWYRIILQGYRYLKAMCDGDYALSAFCNAGPGDMANAIRGDALFTDLYDEPERVHALLDTCADATIQLEEAIRAITGDVAGGSVTANVYFPGHVPYLSEDFYDLCSSSTYAAFGKPHTQKVLDHFKGAYIHHHAKGAHIHKEMTSLTHLRLLEQSWDPNCVPPVERLPDLFAQHGNLPLMIRCHAQDVYTHIDALKQGRVVIMLNIDNLEQGKEVMRFIRRHSII